jgi:transcriptional regulator with XRE-family HTH domain
MLKPSFFPLECKEVLENIGLKIKEKRLDMHMRQLDVAERVGVSVSTVRKIEAGEPGVELGTLLHVLWRLGLLKDVIAVDRTPLPKAELSPRRVRLPSAGKDDF